MTTETRQCRCHREAAGGDERLSLARIAEKLEALTRDHESLAEANHGMLGRILMLEARVLELERATK